MSFFKNYKGVALIYIILTIFNVLWIVNFEKPSNTNQVSNEKNVVVNV